MKKLTFLSILLAITVLFTNCEEEDTVKVDFEIIVTGESPNAIVQLTNTSDDADLFKWEFSEGADVETSEEANPQITVDKTGDFTISLTAINGSNETTKTKKVDITGINGINIYDDVFISEYYHEEEYGFLFSSETGLVYNKTGLRSSSGEIIDMFIAYVSGYDIMIYSPDRVGMFIIPEAQETWFNLNEDNSVTVNDFENIQTDQFNTAIEYPEDYHLIIKFSELPKVIPFKNSYGKYGLIKIQEIFPEHLLMDVKVQKYAVSD